MPRTNRFNVPFSERLRQSRVARGLEAESPAPAECTPAREVINWGSIADEVSGMREAMLTSDSFSRFAALMTANAQATGSSFFGGFVHQGMAHGESMHQNLRRDDAQIVINPHRVRDDAPPAPSERLVFVPGNTHGHIPIPPPVMPPEALDIPSPAELTTLLAARDANPAAQAQRPSAQVADPLTYRDLVECQVQAFMALVPMIKMLLRGTHIDYIANYSNSSSCEFSIATRLPPDNPYLPAENINSSDCGVQMELSRGHVTARLFLRLPTTLLRDERSLLLLRDIATVFDANVAVPLDYVNVVHGMMQPGYGHTLPHGLNTSMFGPAVGGTYQPHLVIPADTQLWEIRELCRMAKGDYMPLPPEALDMLPAGTQLHPHLATKDSNRGMIAFTRDSSAGQFDRQQVMKAGRFFKQYGIDTTDQRAKEFSAIIAGALTFEVKLLSTREEYRWAYAIGPESCMSRGSDYNNQAKFKGCYVDGKWVHPIEVFAHPESPLRLLVVSDGDKVGARTWVNTERKQWARIYTCNNVRGSSNLINEWLEIEGYRQSNTWCEDAPMLRLVTDRGDTICPYIDPGNYGVGVERDRLVIGGSHRQANHETGCLSDEDEDSEADWYCDDCGDGYSEYDGRYTVINGDCVCGHCINNYTAVWNPNQDETQYVHDSQIGSLSYLYDATYDDTCDEDYVFSRNLGRDGYVLLDSDEYGSDCVAQRDMCVVTTNDEWILEEDAEDKGYLYLEETGEWVPDDEACVMVDADGTATLHEERNADTDGYIDLADTDIDEDDLDYPIHKWTSAATTYLHPDFIESLAETESESESEEGVAA